MLKKRNERDYADQRMNGLTRLLNSIQLGDTTASSDLQKTSSPRETAKLHALGTNN